jgi:hypothetical protein
VLICSEDEIEQIYKSLKTIKENSYPPITDLTPYTDKADCCINVAHFLCDFQKQIDNNVNNLNLIEGASFRKLLGLSSFYYISNPMFTD